MAREFIVPNQIITGFNALDIAKETLGQFGKKAMIVTGKTMVELGNCTKVEAALKDQEIEYTVYSEVDGEPTDVIVQDGLEQYKAEECDFLLALGGGSPIDAMKAIGVLLANAGNLPDFMGKNIDIPMPPMVAIPTTAGTGSEVTQFTIITDTQNDVKMLLKGKALMPEMAVIDSQFTLTIPPSITAATGLDALCHAIEAYTSRRAQPLSDVFALSAVKRIFRYLPLVFDNGENEEMRSQMSIAALEAGIAFNNSSVTLIHGLSRPLGAIFHIAHGLSNAMVMKECLSFAIEGACDLFADLGRIIDAASPADTDKVASRKFLEALIALTKKLKVPTLDEYGIDREEFFNVIEKMVFDALESGSPQNTIREVTQADIEQMYKNLWE